MDLNSGAPLVPRAGDATTVMQRGIGSPLSWDGVFETQRGFQIAVRGGVECPFEHEEDVLLASGPLGSRLASLARHYDTYIVVQCKARWPEVIDDRFFNSLLVISRQGEILPLW